MPTLASLHIDVFLTNLSIAYTNEQYVADDVLPVIPVAKRSDKYPVYNTSTFLRSSGVDAQGKSTAIRRPKTRSTEADYSISNLPYYCEQLARSYPLDDAEVNYADAPLQPEIDATMMLNERLRIDNEYQVASKVLNRANYASANLTQLVTNTTSWSTGGATAYPISKDIPGAKKAVVKSLIRVPTHLLMNYAAAIALSQSQEYLADIKYVSMEGLTSGGLLPVVSGLRTVEAIAQYITSAEGAATTTNGYIWVDNNSEDAAFVYYKPSSVLGLRTISLGATFECPDDTLHASGFVVKRWREEWRDVEVIEVRTTRDWRFTATDGSTSGDNSNGYALGGAIISGVTL